MDGRRRQVRVAGFALAVALATCACRANRAYAGWYGARPDIEGVDAELTGPTFGWEGGWEGGSSQFVELRLLEDAVAGVELDEASFGYRSEPVTYGPFELRGQYDFGVGIADVDGFRNTNTVLSIGLGLQPRIRLGRSVALVGLVGYRFSFDRTRPTICNDGTRTSSVGPDPCATHGGVSHESDHIGDYAGFEASLGITIGF